MGRREWQIRFETSAAGELEALDAQVARRVVSRLGWLAENADVLAHQSLEGSLAGLFKLRVGDWRVLYTLATTERLIYVQLIGNRRSVYRDAVRRGLG